MVAVTTCIVAFALPDSGVKIVGEVPGGLPKIEIPTFDNMQIIAVDAMAMAIVSYATTLSLGKIFSTKKGYSFRITVEIYYGITVLFVCALVICVTPLKS